MGLKHKLAIAAGLVAFAMPLVASAATFKSADQVMLSDGATSGNAYVAGGMVHLSGNVDGDFMAAAGDLYVGGDVRDDLTAAGGTIVLLGNVGGDARAAGGDLLVGGDIGGELVLAGGMVSVSSEAVVRGNAYLAGGKMVIDGVIDGDLVVRAEEVDILGEVKGNVSGEFVSLKVADGAKIGGMLAYKAPQEAVVEAGAVIGGDIVYQPSSKRADAGMPMEFPDKEIKRFVAGIIGLAALLKFLGMIVAALVLVLLFEKKSQKLVDATIAGFWPGFLRGLGMVVLSPIGVVLLTLTGVGVVLAMLGASVAVVAFSVGGIYAGVVLGVWIRRVWTKNRKVQADWKSALLGVTLVNLVIVVPVAGWLFKMVLILATAGSFVSLLWNYLRPVKK